MGALSTVLAWTCLTLGAQEPPAAARVELPSKAAAKEPDAKPKGGRSSALRVPKRGAAKDAELALPEHAVADLKALNGQPAVLFLTNGDKLEDVVLESLLAGRGKATFKSVSVQAKVGDKRRTVRSAALNRMEVAGKPYAVVYSAPLKGHVLIDVVARDAQIDARLKTRGERLWPELSTTAQEQALRAAKEYFGKAQAAYPQLQMHETKYFVFYTDLPPAQLAPYIRDLDAMYARLGGSFGVPPGKNIWLGKAVIVMFLQRGDLWRFDQEIMKTPSAVETQARCFPRSDGHVTITGWVGNDAAFFAHVLVHETTHGFLHRHRSTVHVPNWVNEGVADWMAGAIVKSSDETKKRQQRAIRQLQVSGSAGGKFFDAKHLGSSQYGLASALVEYQLRIDPAAYRQFIDGIKEGATPQESLVAAYGLTPEQLLMSFGRQIGVLNLTQ
jgi:hypothetical protein